MTRRPFLFPVTLTGQAVVYAESEAEARALLPTCGVLEQGPKLAHYAVAIHDAEVIA
jgi:hypothetical protein